MMPTEPERKDAPAGAPRMLLTSSAYGVAAENSSPPADYPAVPWKQSPDERRQLAIDLLREQFHLAIEGTHTSKTGRKEARRLEKLFSLVVLNSYGQGDPYATFSDFEEVVGWIGGGLQHLRAALKRLREMNIVHRLPTQKKSVVRLWCNPNPRSWNVEKLIPDDEWEKRISGLDALNREHPELGLVGEPPRRKTIIEGMVEATSEGCKNQSQSGSGSPGLGARPAGNRSQSGSGSPGLGVRPVPHTNVGERSTLKRSTLNVPKGLLQDVQDFVGKEDEHSYGFWAKACNLFPDKLEEAMSTIGMKEQSGFPTKSTHGRRLVFEFRSLLTDAQWARLETQ